MNGGSTVKTINTWVVAAVRYLHGQVKAQQAEERAGERQERLAGIEKDAKHAHAMSFQGMRDALSGFNESIHQEETGSPAVKARSQ